MFRYYCGQIGSVVARCNKIQRDTHQTEQSRELRQLLALNERKNYFVVSTYRLLLRKVTRGTQDDDDGVILEFHGAVGRGHVSDGLD